MYLIKNHQSKLNYFKIYIYLKLYQDKYKMCDRDELREINIKLDHIMFVQCELFAMIKGLENSDNKIDKCIQLLNTINLSLNRTHPVINTNIPRPPPLPKKFIKKEEKYIENISLQDKLIEELKEKKYVLKKPK